MRAQQKRDTARRASPERGFTLTEVLIATIVLMVGIVAVAQLVPASILSNSNNRNDSSATVFAQRQLNQFTSQPLTLTTPYVDGAGLPCAAGCNLGDPTQPGITVGSPVVLDANNRPIINFGATPVAGYSFTYLDVNDPSGTTYDVRWAVITSVSSGGAVSSKRFILGAIKRGGNGIYLPVTLDTMVER
jgi:type II secretory pathway pseudopilin PulG